MSQRERRKPAFRPVGVESMCVLMACSDMKEADQVGRHLSELNTGCLVTYLRAGDFMLNVPSGKVVLVILAIDDSAPALRKALDWLRRRWPGCPITVVGDMGCGEYEMAAREGGATFLTRPVPAEQWSAILSHALGAVRQGVPQRRPEGAQTRKGEPATE